MITTEDEKADPGSTFHGLLSALRRRAWVIVLCMVLAPAAAYAISKSQTKEYTATAQILFKQNNLDQQLSGTAPSAPQPSGDFTVEKTTNVRLITLKRVGDATAKQLGGGLTGSDVSGKISVDPNGDSNLAGVTATDPNPKAAARLANAFAAQYIAFRKAGDRAAILQARKLLQGQVKGLPLSQQTSGNPDFRNLKQQISSLNTLAALQTGNAELVQPADAPSTPSSPKTKRNTFLGVLVGLLIGLLLAFVLELLDRRLKDPKEIEELYERPTLGAIPTSPALAKVTYDAPELKARDRDAFRMLRANLRYFNVDRNVGSVLITSASVGEGKTTVAWNLAAAAAESGIKTLLLEADLRNPRLVQQYNVPAHQGLSDVLSGQAQPGDVVHQVLVANRTNGHAPTPLDVITAGRIPPNPTDLIESEMMRRLIRGAERHYDLVVIDSPPTAVVSDAVPLILQVSGLIVVTRLGVSTRDEAIHLRSQLRNMRAPVLGVVVNGVSEKRSYYSFGYGYGLPGTGTLPGPGEPIAPSPKFELAPFDDEQHEETNGNGSASAPWHAGTS
ncbi:MAG: polysaccharide biosynthesis tyrosine autokinase [Gaiellaceae bacterium]